MYFRFQINITTRFFFNRDMAALVAMATVLLSLSGASSLEFQHHNQSEIELFLADVVDRYPDLTRMYSVGQSIRGRTRYMYNEPCHEKTCLWDFRPDQTQTGLYSYRR